MIVADPGWQFDDALGARGAAAHYKNDEPLELIKNYPLPPIDRDAVLFLWRVAAMTEEAYQVIRAWGFEPNKGEIAWRKLTVTGRCEHFGMGYVVRGAHECCMIATRGKPVLKRRDQRSLFTARVPRGTNGKAKHSAKPDEFFRIVESMYDGPRVSLYERKKRVGFDCFGNEMEKVV